MLQRRLHGLEERRARPLHPLASHGRGRVRRHFPRRLESAEVIDADAIDQRQQGTKALDPPGVSGLLEDIPPVVGISPQLAGRAEVVGRHAGEHGRPAVGVEPEQLSARPDVGAVVRDEDRQIAHDLDRSRAAGVAHALPLLEEQKLRQLVQPDLSSAARRPPRDRRWIALRDVGLPRRPGDLTVRILDGHEQREVVQPARVRAAEAIEAIAHRRRRRRVEAIEHSRPERPTVGDDGGEVDVARLEERARRAASARVSSPSSIRRSRLIEQRIARKRRKALVRRVAVAGRPERQHLPQPLAGGRREDR